jgi:hypothetical protein
MTTLTRTAICLVLAALAGCGKDPETTQKVNAQFTVDTLFTKDGCTVYRFFDYGAERYFTNCRGTVEWKQGCGKNCTRDVVVSGGEP